MLFSFAFVYAWAQVHTGHWFLAANCMAQIIMSVPVTALLYRNVIDGGIDFFQFILNFRLKHPGLCPKAADLLSL